MVIIAIDIDTGIFAIHIRAPWGRLRSHVADEIVERQIALVQVWASVVAVAAPGSEFCGS